jgi:hypothetical protein
MIITYTGRLMDPLNPRVEDISIMDIAHALANSCRFNGHCSVFYSIAQHSFFVSEHVPERAALWGLLHDAAEAYIGDIIRPIKILPESAGLIAIEESIARVIREKFGATVYPEVAEADDRMLAAEMRALRLYQHGILPGVKPYDLEGLRCWSPREAESNFICRFDELYCGVTV